MPTPKISGSFEETKPEDVAAIEPKVKPVIEPEAQPSDSFKLSDLRLNQNFFELTPVKKLLTTIRIKKKPEDQAYVRVHSSPDYRCNFLAVELKEDQDFYLVAPAMANALTREAVPVCVYLGITQYDALFFWVTRLPSPDGRANTWHKTNIEAAEAAMCEWIRVHADQPKKEYEIIPAESRLPDPEWPDKSFEELINIGFKDRIIDSPDHVVFKRLRGRI
jgi:hypothetical protein